jgi:UPF0755 protein
MTHDGSAYDHQATDDHQLTDATLHDGGAVGHHDGYEPSYLGGHRKKKKHGFSGCLAVLIALVVVLGGAYYVGTKGYHYLKDHLADSAADYAGPGHGAVLFQVQKGDSTSAIGRNLKQQGVVASVEAFTKAADGNTGIQVGYYQLKKKMSADEAFTVLSNPENIVTTAVTIPEGLRVVDTVAILAAKTKFPKAAFNAALQDGRALGLPAYAHGNAEGYLFPSTYGFGPKEKPADMLKDMVDRWKQSASDNDLEAGAKAQGRTPGEIMTIASLIQAEGRGSDMPKVSRVIYNRLDGPGDQQGTNGRLQIDATVNYALNRKGVVAVTIDDTHVDSPYNTYQNAGLPPGPINSPGDDAIKAALHPADGDWYYYVTVNLRTGETKFAKTYDEFLQYNQEYQQYCQTSSRC